jgi:ABC-type transport system substrate-binding protein
LKLFLCGNLFLLLLLGCGREGREASDGQRGGTLHLAGVTDITTLDPAIGYDTGSWAYIRLIYRGLLDYDEGTRLVPCLAEKWDISPDGLTFRFSLRRGVRFSHGREVVAGDFKYALERVLDPATTSPGASFFWGLAGAQKYREARQAASRARRENPNALLDPQIRAAAEGVPGIRAPDPYTLEIQLEQPDVSFLNILAMPFAYAVPREAVEEYGENLAVHPVGPGPFQLEEWVRGLRLRLVRNPHYYEPGRPYLDAIEVTFGGNELVNIMRFERGELDLSSLPETDFVRLTSNPRWKPNLLSQPQMAIWYLAMNTQMPPFDHRLVRQAVNWAINKEHIVKIINGRGVPAKGVLPPGMPGYQPDLKGYGCDPERARALLRQAGYPDGFATKLWVRTGRYAGEERIAQAVQQQLAEVGVKVELYPLTFSVWDELAGQPGNCPFTVSAWFQDYPDPSNFLDVLLNGKRIVPKHCNNLAFYNNPQVNRLFDRAAAMTDLAARLKVYQEAERLVVEDAPWVFLYHPITYQLRQPWVQNVRLHPVWPNRLEQLWLKR